MTAAATKCKRCDNDSVTVSRGEAFCKPCFLKFIQFRQRKQMERFKVDYSEPRPPDQHILLPISLGQSSIALLDMCVEMIRAQKALHRGRQGFYLHVVHILDDQDNVERVKSILSKLREKYPECEEIVAFELSQVEKSFSDRESIQISHFTDDQQPPQDEEIFTAMQRMNKTAREDTKNILRQELITKIAEQKKCQTLIEGHCQTRLAELVISMTTKGRGSDMPASINSNGFYPLREVLSNEVGIYNKLQELDELVIPKANPPANVKLQSIDDLVHQYFKSVEKDFPSVVSTVVRTATKLGTEESQATCSICNGDRGVDTLDWIKKITVNAPKEDAGETLCYGCMVMLRNSTDKLNWPRYDTQDVLNEYEL